MTVCLGLVLDLCTFECVVFLSPQRRTTAMPQIWHSNFIERYLAARIAARDSAVTISHPSLLCSPGALNVADSR